MEEYLTVVWSHERYFHSVVESRGVEAADFVQKHRCLERAVLVLSPALLQSCLEVCILWSLFVTGTGSF